MGCAALIKHACAKPHHQHPICSTRKLITASAILRPFFVLVNVPRRAALFLPCIDSSFFVRNSPSNRYSTSDSRVADVTKKRRRSVTKANVAIDQFSSRAYGMLMVVRSWSTSRMVREEHFNYALYFGPTYSNNSSGLRD